MIRRKNGNKRGEPGALEFDRILVPVSGSKADREAIKIACSLAKKSKGKVYAIYVIQVKRSLPLDAGIDSETRYGEEVLEQAEQMADEEDYEVETEVLQAREVGPAIVDEAVERDVNLILIGMDYKKRFGEFSLGRVVPYVLKEAPCRVLLYREATT
jgi:nucleotide-binding universal stress UspA family protein